MINYFRVQSVSLVSNFPFRSLCVLSSFSISIRLHSPFIPPSFPLHSPFILLESFLGKSRPLRPSVLKRSLYQASFSPHPLSFPPFPFIFSSFPFISPSFPLGMFSWKFKATATLCQEEKT